MPSPIIGYDNVFNQGNISATSEAAGFAKENAVDWLTYDFWKPTAAGTVYLTVNAGYGSDVDYLGIAAHDLGTNGATAQLEYWTGSAWAVASAVLAPTNDNVLFTTFTSVNSDQFRLKIVSPTAASKIGIVSAGQRLALERNVRVGWVPPLISGYDIAAHFSEENNLLGRSLITRMGSATVDLTGLTESWLRSNWIGLLNHAKSKPFFMQWDSTGHTSEVALYFVKSRLELPSYSGNKHMTTSLDCSYLL